MITAGLSPPLHHSKVPELMVALRMFGSAVAIGMLIGFTILWPTFERPACTSAVTGKQALPWLNEMRARDMARCLDASLNGD